MTPPVRILGLSGSLRRASINTGLLRLAQRVAPSDVELTTHDLTDLPFFNADVEALGDPAPVVALKAAIREADGVLIASPEYNLTVTAALKNAIDWASRPFAERPLAGTPVAIMGAGGGGGTRHAQQYLRTILGLLGMEVVAQPEVLVVRANKLANEAGDIDDADVTALVTELVDALAEAARARRAAGDA